MVAPEVDDEGFQPLVRTKDLVRKDCDSCTTSKTQSLIHRHWKWAAALFGASFVSVIIFNHIDSSCNATQVDKKWAWGKCAKSCKSHEELHKEKWGGDLLDTATMIRRAEEEKEKLVARLKVDYGEKYYAHIFLNENGESIGRTGFHGANSTLDISRRRFVRKLKMKILSVQVAVQEEARNVNGCNCGVVSDKKRYLQGSKDENKEENDTSASSPLDQLPDHYARMVFVNAGHSSAAGHGNYFSETYTAVMERSAKDVFAAVGIEFEGRNHAMGGMKSTPELALCSEAVYGLDADLITWNFGMTDGCDFWRHSLFSNRRGVHRNRPLMLEIDAGKGNDWAFEQRGNILRELEEAGLAAMFMSVNYFYHVDEDKDWFPDMQKMTQPEIDAVPKFLRYYKCGEKVEDGDPFCEEKKYTDECTPHKAPWHPGWKAHALQGNILAIFMVDLLLDALKDLQEDEPLDPEAEPPNPKAMLALLQSEEDEDYERFFESSIPDYELVSKGLWNESITEDHGLLFRNPAICHTALLPSQTRYKGYLTEMENSSFENFDIGISEAEADQQNATIESTMQLVYKEKYPTCSSQVAIDYKDFFYVTANSGVARLTIPNKAEKEAYEAKEHKFHGLIIFCLVGCPWGECPEGFIGSDEIKAGKLNLFVNGNQVKELFPVNSCFLLRGDQGYSWTPNDHGEYELAAMLHDPDGFLQMSSIILI